MDRCQYAAEKVTADGNLSELECDSDGVVDNARADFDRLSLEAGQNDLRLTREAEKHGAFATIRHAPG